MRKITHYYSLSPDWQFDLAAQMNTELIDNKLMIVPKDIGEGFFYFSPIMDGISVVYAELTATAPLEIFRKKSDDALFIFHFDLSEHMNIIQINNVNYEIGCFSRLDLSIFDNENESIFVPEIGKKNIALRLLIDKKLLQDFIKKFKSKEVSPEQANSNDKNYYHYGNIDSNSTLLIQSIKNKSVYDLSFDSFIKGISLKVLGNFFNKLYESADKSIKLTEIENEGIEKTKNYLMKNIYGPFPSLIFLAGMAGMSASKYKSLFKKRFNNTPKNLFIEEKINLAEKMIKSGDYYTLTEVMYELGYTKLSYFCTKYYEKFNRKPLDDFKRNDYPRRRLMP